MADYAEPVKALRCCSKIDARNNGCDSCPYEYCGDDCQNLCGYAADAIEELLAAVSSVVKCKECGWCHSGYCEKYDDLIPFGCANKPWEDWFCADGKRPEPPKEDAE